MRTSFRSSMLRYRACGDPTSYALHRVKATRPRMQPRQASRASSCAVGSPTFSPISRAADSSTSISTGRAASTSCSIDVLKAPSLRVMAFAILAALFDRTADPRTDRRRLAHDLQTKGVDERVVEHLVDGRAGQRRDGVHGHVAPQLVPDVALNAGRDLDVEARVRQRSPPPCARASSHRRAARR